jgi:small basic protein
MPASTADEIIQQMETSMQDALSAGTILTGFFFNIIIYPVFGMLGGLVGYGIFKPKQPPVAAQ